ncbi:GNAT family N-acetyltransferase [Thalassotalea psychrophila]|uniref:GNAT family N-acetyltransferase n=1 Tax=Thalassotalea psychrophila TaxID=3065647 RepID=A0ABY9TXY5_9GAMM|nr:GNAT family N-acetyltransferase [Colwelliaceae bacterium SQ149]
MNVESSARLSFRLMDENDGELLFELDQDPQVMQFINGGKPSTWDDINNRFIPRINAYRKPSDGWGLWQVNISETGEFIGWVLVRPVDFFNKKPLWNNLELGWRFKQTSWGKGYGFEAAQQVKIALAQRGKAEFFTASADEGNIGSINIMKKLGMVYLKTELHKGPLGGINEVYYQVNAN